MKKTNKGFSMVELIIVIAIMAIIAGALAPALMKYINKSRLATDIQTGQSIAEAIQTALTDEDAAADAQSVSTPTMLSGLTKNNFRTAVYEALGQTDGTVIVGKAKKGGARAAANTTFDQEFYVTFDPDTSLVQVYYGNSSADNDNMVYPSQGKNVDTGKRQTTD